MDREKTPRRQDRLAPQKMDSPNPLKPCHLFFQTGRCRFGDNCKFSHVSSPTRKHQPLSGNQDKLREWKRLLNQGRPENGYSQTRLSAEIVSLFFERGLEIMEGDLGASQDAVKLLGGNTGLNFVKAMTDQHVPQATTDVAKINVWKTQVSPFFQLITHPRLVDSNVLEQEVATIYSFLVGVNATRVNRLFKYVLDVTMAWPKTGLVLSHVTTALELSLSVLSKAIDCSTAIIVNDEFQGLVERFADLIGGSAQSQDDFASLQATKYLNYLQRRLGVGKDMGAFQALPDSATGTRREEFVLRRDLPGHLSADGPRHDNDHAEISKIKIMPTYEEIMTPRSEYLPTTDSSQWHLPGIRGRLDREFRLLREDTIGQLRDAVRDILGQVRSHSKNSARTISYKDATVYNATIDSDKGLELEVQCKQPDTVRKMSEQDRGNWWDQSKRLQAGALVCILNAVGSVQFCVVAESTLRTEKDKKAPDKREKEIEEETDQTDEKPRTLSFSSEALFVKINLVENSPAELGRAMRWYKDIRPGPTKHLVEFPGILLASFKHTLEALQQLSQNPDLPFSDLIAPQKPTSGAEVRISAPLFARAPGFVYDLSCVTKNAKTKFPVTIDRLPTADEVSSKTGLDSSQSEALLSTLSRELSLIQGPPGTGKSHTGEKIIQVLLANRMNAKLGPIICVCYTNHALDQLLEHLLDNGIDSIIRMGSRSKSPRLEGFNLQSIAWNADMTKTEKSERWQARGELREIAKQCHRQLRALASFDSPVSIREYLRSANKAHHDELFPPGVELDSEGYRTVKHKIKNPIQHWLREGGLSTHHTNNKDRDLAMLQLTRLRNMTNPERKKIFSNWLKNIRDPIVQELVEMHRDYAKVKTRLDRTRQEVRRRCLQQAQVIGVTTTGLAAQLSLLRKLRSKVIVCEEAGEVLEAHLLTTLLPSVEHAILIGDHLQLRPQIQNYDLQSTNPRGHQYSLDMSLFERLVQPPHPTDLKLPFSSLETQRRMHPSIADMVRSTLYPNLVDGEKVKSYPEVVGMGRRLFWFHHDQLEAAEATAAAATDPTSTSHSNNFEVEMGAALVSHLIKQGHYSPEDIAVLTPYLGQLKKLRQRMAAEPTFAVGIDERDLEELENLDRQDAKEPLHSEKANVSKTTLLKSVRLATVDNFQGEEAKVIIISLVRSNPRNKCGFLETSNRINVLLSRAKHGCYLIGNSKTYSNVPMWNQVLQLLKDGGNFGTSLELKCPRHPDKPILVSRPDDFSTFSPDGGCNSACDRRLDCGHACYGRCHSKLLHKAIKCHEKCPRLKTGCDHACPRECGDPCEDQCNVVLRNLGLQLPCGHIVQSAKCWESQSPALICCREMVERRIPGCDHTLKLACHIDVSSPNFVCSSECRESLPCGHNCRSQCYKCRERKDGKITQTNHGICKQPCGRKYTACPHHCQLFCHGKALCAPCSQPCEVRCSHSRCGKPCHEPCAPCAEEDCASRCPHTQCSMPCAAPCDWIPCSKRCSAKLTCGHQCPSLCGETCPDARFCQQCGSESVLSAVVDYLLMGEYRDADLDQDPCIFPDCGHFLTKSSMDGQMSMGDHYELDENGSPIAIKAPSAPFSMDGSTVKFCPQCRGSLRSICRYGRIIRRAMLDESTKKFISWSGDRHLQLAERFLQVEQQLETYQTNASEDVGRAGNLNMTGPVPGQLAKLHEWVGKGRYKSSLRVYMDIMKYRDQVKAQEQPFQKVAYFVKHANRTKTTGSFSFDESVIQLRGYLLAMELLIKCNILIFTDFFNLRKGAASTRTEITVDFSANMEQCKELVHLAVETSRPQLEASGHVYYAQFCGLALALDQSSLSLPNPPVAGAGDVPGSALQEPPETAKPNPREILASQGQEHLKRAKTLMEVSNWPSKHILETEIEAVECLLQGGVFYKPVTNDELRAVYTAMASEFHGTGHWYVCERGHPFTVGECGLPMEQALCPECGAPVGGQRHEPAEGVRHAREIEELARNVESMTV